MARGNGTGNDSERIAALESQCADLVVQNQQLLARLDALLAQRTDTGERVERLETALGQNPEDLAAFARWKDWAALDAQQKSQLEADRAWPESGLPRWKVSIWKSP